MRDTCIRKHYEDVAWVEGDEKVRRLTAWKNGKTGFPVVDAGMRELYATGFQNQSIRMVCASFLVEYLRIDWKEGEAWFHDTLIDADPAINAMMWQNAGASGIDQWNFVSSPTTASQDATGAYTRKWVRELEHVPKKYLHKPWTAPRAVLEKAGVTIGVSYPNRIIVDASKERRLRTEAIISMRRSHQELNDSGGYDLVALPDGTLHRVFTRQMYRIDRAGKLKPPPKRRKIKRNKSSLRR